MNYGLSESNIKKVLWAVSTVPAIEEVLVYGSRAMDTYREGSDMDLVLKGKSLNLHNSVYPLMEALESLMLPWKFDIAIYDHLKNQDLIQHIERVGQTIYSKNKDEEIINSPEFSKES